MSETDEIIPPARDRDPAPLRVLALFTVVMLAECAWLFTNNFLYQSAAVPVLLAGILLTKRWWSLRTPAVCAQVRPALSENAKRQMWIGVAAATMLAVWPRSARLDFPLAKHEIQPVQGHIQGLDRGDAPGFNSEGLPVFPPKNPHGAWATIEALAGNAIAAGSPENGGRFHERWMRIFPWLSGLVTVALAGLLGSALGGPRAGLAVALILAMHPAHTEWSSEIGGVSTMLMALTASLLCLIQALQTNRWRWWLGLSAAQVFCLFSHGGAVMAVPVMYVVACAVIVFSRSPGAHKIASMVRLLITAVPMLLPLTVSPGPGIDQISLDDGNILPPVIWGVSPEGSQNVQEWSQEMWRGISAAWVLPAIGAMGLCFLLVHDWRSRLVTVTLAGPLFLSGLCGTGFRQFRRLILEEDLYPLGYNFFWVVWPCLVLLLPLALVWAGVGLSRFFPGNSRVAQVPLFIAVAYVLTTLPAENRMITVPFDPTGEAMRVIDNKTRNAPNAIIACYGRDLEIARLYRPDVHILENTDELDRLVTIAFENERSLFVMSNGGTHRGFKAELERSGRFHLIHELTAFEPKYPCRVYQYFPRDTIIRMNVKKKEETKPVEPPP